MSKEVHLNASIKEMNKKIEKAHDFIAEEGFGPMELIYFGEFWKHLGETLPTEITIMNFFGKNEEFVKDFPPTLRVSINKMSGSGAIFRFHLIFQNSDELLKFKNKWGDYINDFPQGDFVTPTIILELKEDKENDQ